MLTCDHLTARVVCRMQLKIRKYFIRDLLQTSATSWGVQGHLFIKTFLTRWNSLRKDECSEADGSYLAAPGRFLYSSKFARIHPEGPRMMANMVNITKVCSCIENAERGSSDAELHYSGLFPFFFLNSQAIFPCFKLKLAIFLVPFP